MEGQRVYVMNVERNEFSVFFQVVAHGIAHATPHIVNAWVVVGQQKMVGVKPFQANGGSVMRPPHHAFKGVGPSVHIVPKGHFIRNALKPFLRNGGGVARLHVYGVGVFAAR
mgnify:FL=1